MILNFLLFSTSHANSRDVSYNTDLKLVSVELQRTANTIILRMLGSVRTGRSLKDIITWFVVVFAVTD